METEGAEKTGCYRTLESCGKWETSQPEKVSATEDANLVSILRTHEQHRVRENKVRFFLFLFFFKAWSESNLWYARFSLLVTKGERLSKCPWCWRKEQNMSFSSRFIILDNHF